MNIKVSVLVPVYNVEHYIERCARSLFEQSLNDIEFIFVDDRSPDNSIDVLKKVAAEYPSRSVRIVHHAQNSGLAAVRKTAIRNAKGKYVICCDSDDWAEPDMYERMLRAAEREDADLVCCGFVAEGGKQEFVTHGYEKETKAEILDPNRFGWVWGAQWNKLVRADLYKECCLAAPDGVNMWEDSCVTLPLRLASRKTVILSDCLYHYNIENNASICHERIYSLVPQMAKAVRFLEGRLTEQRLTTEAEPLLHHLKLYCKNILAGHFSKEHLKMLKTIFPEVKMWREPNVGRKTKLRFWLMDVLPVSAYVWLRSLKRKLCSFC